MSRRGGPELVKIAPADYTNYSESVQEDEFHRIDKTQTVVDDDPVQESVSTFHDDTGWVTRRASKGWDESLTTPAWGSTSTTDYVHDDLGRVVETHEYGTTATSGNPERIRYTHYDGMGQVYLSYAENYAGTETGIITETTYDLAGRRIEELRGLAFGTTDLYEKREWAYDLAGRTTTASRIKDPGGTPSTESTTYTYDFLGRTLTVDTPETGTTEYVYGYDSSKDNIPTVEVTDEEGVTRATTKNQLGNALVVKISVATGGPVLGGADQVEYTYDASTGCGCIVSGSPHVVKTFAGGTEVTSVTREYNPRGDLMLDQVTVDRPGTGPTVTTKTEMEYDAAGRKTKVTYPLRPATGEAASVLTYSYRGDGQVESMSLDEDSGGVVELASYEYEGTRERWRRQNAYVATSTRVADTTTTYDELGRPEKKDYDLPSSMGFKSSFSTDTIVTGQEPRNIDGQLTWMRQVPRHKDETTGPVITASYGGSGRLASEQFEIGDAGSGALTIDRDYTWNSLGELTDIDEDWDGIPVDSACDNSPAETFEYARDYSGGTITGILPAGPKAFNQVNDYDVYGSGKFLEKGWYDHTESRNDSGWLDSTEDYYFHLQWCHCTDDTGGPMWRHFYRVDREYGRDGWGRMVTYDYSRELLIDEVSATTDFNEDDSESIDCTGTSIDHVEATTAHTLTFPTEERVYDGYGRLVFSLRPMEADDMLPLVDSAYDGFELGMFHAYDGGELVASMGADPSGTPNEEEHESHIEYYRNPSTGQTDKMHVNRDSSYPTSSPDPDNPWHSSSSTDFTGGAFATPLYDLQGRLALLNATPPGTGEDEVPYSDEARVYTPSGAAIDPQFELSLWPISFLYCMLPNGGEEEGKVIGDGTKGLSSSGCTYKFTIKTRETGVKYSSALAFMASAALGTFIGHSWVEVAGPGYWTSGGHTGETGILEENPEITNSNFLKYSSGVLYLSALPEDSPSPIPKLASYANPASPIHWLNYDYKDGKWKKETTESKFTRACTWCISEEEFKKVVAQITKYETSPALLENYGLKRWQCTSTAAYLAEKAGVMLDPFVVFTVPSRIGVSGFYEGTRLRSTRGSELLRFALPEKLGDLMESWEGDKEKVCRGAN